MTALVETQTSSGVSGDTGRGAWDAIVADALRAPSPHNTQPWRVRVTSAQAADLLYVPSRLLPKTDADGRFMTIAMGIFAEALDIAAQARGLRVACDYTGTRFDFAAVKPQMFARLRLVPSAERPAFDRELSRSRRTARAGYDGRAASVLATHEMSEVARSFGHTAAFTSVAADIDWAVNLNIDTLFYDLRHDGAREEIGEYIRSTDREAFARGDGFAPSAIGFSPLLVSGFFRHHRVFDAPGVRDLIRAIYARSYRGTRTVGWIAGPQETPEQWFATGRMFLRFWLTAEKHGLVLQPFGSVITNPTAHARLVERIQIEEQGEETWLLFRIGYPTTTPPASPRLALSEVLR